MHRRSTSGIWACTAALLALSGGAQAQDAYPTQPIVLIVPFSAGGPSDTVARVIAQSMSGELGQQVLVENVGGAGGTVGAGRVAAAEPDGYTLLLGHIAQAIGPAIYANLPFDPVEDFAPIGLATDAAMTIIARRDFPADDVPSLLQEIRTQGENLTYAHGGIGGASHLCGIIFQEATGAAMTTVPYQGTGPAMTDLLGGQVDLMCDQTTNTVPQIQSGDVKGYAVTSKERVAGLPDLPTTAESGLEGVEISVWHGLFGPAGMDPTVVERLQAALVSALGDEAVLQRLAAISTTAVTPEEATPEALAERLSSQIDFWGPVIQRAGVYAN